MFSRGARAARRSIFRGMATSARSTAGRTLIAGGVVAGVAAGAILVNQFQKLAEESDIMTPQVSVAHAESVPFYGAAGTKHERTFIAIKPDGVHRALVGEVIKRFEAKGYKLVALKLLHPTPDFAAKHYDDLKTKPFFPGLVKYFSSGPVVAMVWEGRNVIAGGRKLVGATRPDDATPGTVRGDFCIDVGRNVIHGSDSADSAKAEISLWFTEKEVLNYDIEHSNKWVYEK